MKITLDELILKAAKQHNVSTEAVARTIDVVGKEMGTSTKYVITGVLKNGKRFKPIHTDTPWHYNIWQGTVWEKLANGKRKKVQEVYN